MIKLYDSCVSVINNQELLLYLIVPLFRRHYTNWMVSMYLNHGILYYALTRIFTQSYLLAYYLKDRAEQKQVTNRSYVIFDINI